MAIRTHWAMRCLRLFGVEPAAYQPFASYAIRLGFKSAGIVWRCCTSPAAMIWKDYAAGCCIFRRLVPSRSPTVNCSSPIEFLAVLFSTGRAVQHLTVVRESFRAGGVGFTIMDLQAASRGDVGDCRQRADGVG